MYTIGTLGTDRLREIENLAVSIFFIKQTLTTLTIHFLYNFGLYNF